MYLDITTLDICSGCLISEQTIHTNDTFTLRDVLIYGASRYEHYGHRLHNESRQHVGYMFRSGSEEYYLISHKSKDNNSRYEYL